MLFRQRHETTKIAQTGIAGIRTARFYLGIVLSAEICLFVGRYIEKIQILLNELLSHNNFTNLPLSLVACNSLRTLQQKGCSLVFEIFTLSLEPLLIAGRELSYTVSTPSFSTFHTRTVSCTANMAIPDYGAAPIAKTFILLRSLSLVAMIAIVGLTANFVAEIVSANITPPDEIVGTLVIVRVRPHPAS